MSGAPSSFSQGAIMTPSAGADMGVPGVMLPFKRTGTDVVSRKLDIFPYPVAQITSANASQVLRFDFPPSVMYDGISQGLELSFTLAVTGNSISDQTVFSRIQCFPGERMGHLINTI